MNIIIKPVSALKNKSKTERLNKLLMNILMTDVAVRCLPALAWMRLEF
jgi:hypothetical protein